MFTAIYICSDMKSAAQVQSWVRQALGEKLTVEAFPSIDAYKAMLDGIAAAAPAAPAPAAPGAPAPAAPAAPGQAAAAKPAPAAGGADPNKKVRVFILDLELLGAKPTQMVAELQKITAEKAPGMIDTGTPRVLLAAFEASGVRIETLAHESIDDLILKPMDKTLLFQKLEFLISDGGNVSPSFLFRAKTDQIIEVGRDAVIDEISEFAVAVRSPGPIPDGVFAAVHADVFGPKTARRIIARAYESLKHPAREGEYLVRFMYFGISSDQLSSVRRFLKAHEAPAVKTKTLASSAGAKSVGLPGKSPAQAAAGKPGLPGKPAAPGLPGKPAAAPAAPAAPGAAGKPGMSKELLEKMAMLKLRKFAVIDLNGETLEEAKTILEGGFKGLSIRTFPSYTRLIHALRQLVPPEPPKATASPGGAAKPGAAKPGEADAEGGDEQSQAGETKSELATEPPFPTGKKLSLVLRGKTHEVVRFEPALKKTQVVLGRTVAAWAAKPDQWVSGIHKEDKDSFGEFASFIEAGAPGRANFRVVDSSGGVVFLQAVGTLEKAGGADGSQLLRVDLTEIDKETYNKAIAETYGANALPKDPGSYRFDGILIDSGVMRPDPATWYEEFIGLLRSAKVLNNEDPPPKIYVMMDPKGRGRLEDFRVKGFNCFMYKPLERRYLVNLISSQSPNLMLATPPETPPWVNCEVPARLGNEVKMNEIAEYGLSIIHPSEFREKSQMRFFSPLFGESGEWITGRSQSSEKVGGEGESGFQCNFMFFGAGEDLLQRIRRWIREDHVAKKEKT